jgi:hypothetical protein
MWLVFIIRYDLVYKELEEFLENRNLDVHIDRFSKTESKCSNLKHCHLGLLYITENIEYMLGQNICRFVQARRKLN